MTIDQGEYKSKVGLDDLYYAEVTQDDAAGYVADTPAYLAPIAELSAEPAVNTETQYADDGPYDTFSSEGETTLTMRVTGVPLAVAAFLTGNVFDASTGRVYDYGGTPPYVALGFKSLKSNGSYRYYWYLKGRFSVPTDEFATKTDTPDPKTTELIFTAVRSIYAFDLGDINAATKRVFGDEDTENFSGTTWFSQVQTPAVASPSSLALSSSTPADNATGILITANITLVFNNTLAANAENGCVLLDDATAVVASVKTISADRKTVTINPDASLTNSKEYFVAIGVTDIYGDTLDTQIDFTTVAL